MKPVRHATLQAALLIVLLWPTVWGATWGATAARADDEHQGLQAGWAIDDQGNVNFTSSFSLQNRYMHEAEASWIRLNFRLGACYHDWVGRGLRPTTRSSTSRSTTASRSWVWSAMRPGPASRRTGPPTTPSTPSAMA